jgi:nitrate reductase gamma subunit
MDEKEAIINENNSAIIAAEEENWKGKVMLIGGVVGLLAGLGAAYMLIQRATRDEEKPELNLVEGIKLGLLVLGTLRQISQLGEGK